MQMTEAEHLGPLATETLSPGLQAWKDYILNSSPDGLNALIHEDAVFTSPVVHTPQRGKKMVFAYLWAAAGTLGGGHFKYTRLFDCGQSAVLEFETEMDGILVNGVDMIEWDADGLITDFKVMVRPLKGMQAVHAAMGAMLEKMKKGA